MTNVITSKNFRPNHLSIHVEERAGDEPALILLHGISMSGQVWQAQLQSKALESRHLISVELPGHGASGWSTSPDQDYSIPGYASMLKELIPQLTNGKYILLGYSLGGNIAIEALPDLQNCIGVMAVNSAIAARPADVQQAFRQEAAAELATIFKEDADEEELNRYAYAFFMPGNENMPNSLSSDFKKTDPKARAILAQNLQEERLEDEVAILRNATVPVALVTGAEDRLGNNQYLAQLDVPKWKNTTVQVPKAGHIPQLENSPYFDAALLEFITYCEEVSNSNNVPQL